MLCGVTWSPQTRSLKGTNSADRKNISTHSKALLSHNLLVGQIHKDMKKKCHLTRLNWLSHNKVEISQTSNFISSTWTTQSSTSSALRLACVCGGSIDFFFMDIFLCRCGWSWLFYEWIVDRGSMITKLYPSRKVASKLPLHFRRVCKSSHVTSQNDNFHTTDRENYYVIEGKFSLDVLFFSRRIFARVLRYGWWRRCAWWDHSLNRLCSSSSGNSLIIRPRPSAVSWHWKLFFFFSLPRSYPKNFPHFLHSFLSARFGEESNLERRESYTGKFGYLMGLAEESCRRNSE